jgi:hypothetical protein
MKMEIDVRDELKEEFERQAEWRRSKAEEYPDDNRNLEAAAIFDKLAASTKDVNLSVFQSYQELFEGLQDSEKHSNMIREIGFQRWPETADEFCRNFIAEQTGG